MHVTRKDIRIIDVTAESLEETGIYCLKDKRAPGYQLKAEWFKSNSTFGLKIRIAVDNQGNQLGFIEYIPSESAWRPVNAKNYMFIHCILIFSNDFKGKGIGSALLEICESDARQLGKSGICAMSSDGPWMADKTLYEKNGFHVGEKLGRFELMIKRFDNRTSKPVFIDWTKQQAQYKGWNLIYSDQCPWHDKSVRELKQSALEYGIKLSVKKLTSFEDAQNSPSGFGTFVLIKDGKLIEDHYLSKKRFENIVKKEIFKKD